MWIITVKKTKTNCDAKQNQGKKVKMFLHLPVKGLDVTLLCLHELLYVSLHELSKNVTLKRKVLTLSEGKYTHIHTRAV